jgi:hypothetical protein
VRHYHALNWAKFLRQHFNYGRGAFTYHYSKSFDGHVGRHIKQAGNRIRVEPATFYLNLALYPFKKSKPDIHALLLSILLGITQASNAAGFFWEKLLVRRPAQLPLTTHKPPAMSDGLDGTVQR